MKILVVGAGVIGATYAWQLSEAGHNVTAFVRAEKKDFFDEKGIEIHCTDERARPQKSIETVFRPAFVESFSPQDGYELILVCVKSNQLDSILPILAEKAGDTDILFFQNNWWGDQHISKCLPARQYFFGFSRLIGGWKSGNRIDCIIFSGPGQVTLLGEKDGPPSSRVLRLKEMLGAAGMKPQVSPDILGWLMAHYVEYLGAVGAILEGGSTAKFVATTALVRDAILATREGLDVCRARGLNLNKSAPLNLRMFYLPTFITVPLGKISYGMPNIQQFFDENIAHGMDEITRQYFDVLNEGHRLQVKMPHLEAFEPYYTKYRAA